MPHKSIEQIEKERIASIPANREKALQEALMDIPIIGKGKTAPEALNTTHLDVKGKNGTPVYINRRVNLT